MHHATHIWKTQYHYTTQGKWTTFLPWFQWNPLLLLLRRSFSLPVSFWKSYLFSPIITPFLVHCIFTYTELSCYTNLIFTWFDIQYFIPNLLIASFFKSLSTLFLSSKLWDPKVIWKMLSICPIHTMCDEPHNCHF